MVILGERWRAGIRAGIVLYFRKTHFKGIKCLVGWCTFAERSCELRYVRPNAQRRAQVGGLNGFHIFRKFNAVDSVAVPRQVPRDVLKGKGLSELLRGPLGRRMSGDIEMHDPPREPAPGTHTRPETGSSAR